MTMLGAISLYQSLRDASLAHRELRRQRSLAATLSKTKESWRPRPRVVGKGKDRRAAPYRPGDIATGPFCWQSTQDTLESSFILGHRTLDSQLLVSYALRVASRFPPSPPTQHKTEGHPTMPSLFSRARGKSKTRGDESGFSDNPPATPVKDGGNATGGSAGGPSASPRGDSDEMGPMKGTAGKKRRVMVQSEPR